jgi:hypothetical protein
LTARRKQGYSFFRFFVFFYFKEATFNGGTIAMTQIDFELYTWSISMNDMDLPQDTTLDALIATMTDGHINNYAEWKTSMEPMIAEWLGDAYVDLSFLPIALYKDPACAEEFDGTETGKDNPSAVPQR